MYEVESLKWPEEKETKSMSDYLPSVPNQKDTDDAINSEKKQETTFKNVIKTLWKVIHSDEMKEFENTLKSFSKEQMKEMEDYVNEHIKPEIDNFKKTLKDKWVFEKIKWWKEKAGEVINELLEKAKELKESNPEQARKHKLQALLLQQASKENIVKPPYINEYRDAYKNNPYLWDLESLLSLPIWNYKMMLDDNEKGTFEKIWKYFQKNNIKYIWKKEWENYTDFYLSDGNKIRYEHTWLRWPDFDFNKKIFVKILIKYPDINKIK